MRGLEIEQGIEEIETKIDGSKEKNQVVAIDVLKCLIV